MPAPSEVRVGTREETADATTRTHLSDGRVLGWYGEPGLVIDAEIAAQPVPAALAARFGSEDFWVRWTRAECAAKLADVPIVIWLAEHGLTPGPYAVDTRRLGELVVSVAEVAKQPA